ncbi:MAG TPA: hypothetical protein VKB07_00185 [Gaiellaceae bacterium]|nr:hypothetical protein [Gaiellaceae bacterium]
MRHRVVVGARVLGGIVALLAAAALAVFASDVLAAQSTMKRDDLRFGVTPDANGLWNVEGRTPSLKSILSIEDDLAWRTAAQRFQLSRARANIAYDPSRTSSRADSQAALATAETFALTPRQASALANFSAILAYEEAVGDPQNGPMLLRRSTGEFRRSIRLYPRNEEAKFNLEILMSLLTSENQQRRDRLGVGTGVDDAAGAGAAAEGAGY